MIVADAQVFGTRSRFVWLFAVAMSPAALATCAKKDAPPLSTPARPALTENRPYGKTALTAREVVETGARFAEAETTEMRPFWNCAMSSDDVDMGVFENTDQIRQRIESAYFVEEKTFPEKLLKECVPKLEGARAALSSLARDAPPTLKEAEDSYLAMLPKLRSGFEDYARKIKGRVPIRDMDLTIDQVGAAFSPKLTVASAAFEKFLVCAIPDLDQKKDLQEVLEFMAATCKVGAVAFMNRAREQCGPMIQNLHGDAKPAPSKTFKVNIRKTYDEDLRLSQAWEYCRHRSQTARKAGEVEPLVGGVSSYLKAREGVVESARGAPALAP